MTRLPTLERTSSTHVSTSSKWAVLTISSLPQVDYAAPRYLDGFQAAGLSGMSAVAKQSCRQEQHCQRRAQDEQNAPGYECQQCFH
jgi:hypothetical protein